MTKSKEQKNSKTQLPSVDLEQLESSESHSVSDYEVLPSLDDQEQDSLSESSEDDFIEITRSDKDESETDSSEEELNLPILSEKLPALSDPSSNKLNQYLKEISRYDLLSREQELALAKALKETGDVEIAKKLVVSNLRLVVKIAMEYKYAYSNVMDLIQEGNVGLMKAVSLYDPDKGAKLSYYASWWIRSYVLKFILDNFRLVKIGTTNDQKKLFYNLMREKQRLLSMGIDPDHKTLAENLDVSEKAVALMDMRLGESGSEISIDHKVSDESSQTFGDFLSSGEDFTEDISYQQSLNLLQDNLDDFISTLKERDREIFQKRLLDEAPASLQAIADDYGVSRERIRQIEARLLKNLKLYMGKFIR
ncbi:RNA polymerase factor sigma-32 [Bacteriovorax sp. DB6_IX]|uniref:RNA polymerase factor sigma-32 n=2 Tax=Bacteriovorax sp. DB6_IX TaxID=1353530 RepID=UPI00038A429A|nr:RNA polymerase factor sigma-32 [Bacteriovorax sp. DB6_IX]EQC51366.1 putative alternative sigma factor RpoH [Bacteriovorax sp. DB6_IX]